MTPRHESLYTILEEANARGGPVTCNGKPVWISEDAGGDWFLWQPTGGGSWWFSFGDVGGCTAGGYLYCDSPGPDDWPDADSCKGQWQGFDGPEHGTHCVTAYPNKAPWCYESYIQVDDVSRGMPWSFATDGGVESSPTLSADGKTLFVGSYDKSVYALSAADGSTRWTFATGGPVRRDPALSPDGSTVYVGSDDRYVYALSAAAGSVQWRSATGDAVWCSPAVSADGSMVYVGSNDGSVHALRAADGERRWRFATGGGVMGSIALSADGSTLYFGSLDANV
jgi:outer membrane protein assembly factor BamB